MISDISTSKINWGLIHTDFIFIYTCRFKTYIFFTFLKLGATAFGGYMSLVAIVQKQLVEVDKKLKEEDLLDGIFLTSVLPGPVAVNTIAYVGYHLRGDTGGGCDFCRNHYSLRSYWLYFFRGCISPTEIYLR